MLGASPSASSAPKPLPRRIRPDGPNGLAANLVVTVEALWDMYQPWRRLGCLLICGPPRPVSSAAALPWLTTSRASCSHRELAPVRSFNSKQVLFSVVERQSWCSVRRYALLPLERNKVTLFRFLDDRPSDRWREPVWGNTGDLESAEAGDPRPVRHRRGMNRYGPRIVGRAETFNRGSNRCANGHPIAPRSTSAGCTRSSPRARERTKLLPLVRQSHGIMDALLIPR